MRQMEGVYKADCYEIPPADITKIAINMERLRWADLDLKAYTQVNIPSYTLKFVGPDTVYEFKVVVGKPASPTLSLNSNITYITTYPKYKVTSKSSERLNAPGMVAFKFPNNYAISLHDTRDQQSFAKEERALGNNGIRVENAVALARLMLKNYGDAGQAKQFERAMKSHLARNISLNRPAPIRITYFTCEVIRGEVINYKDIYNLDKSLEMALYNSTETLTIK
jgi:murein L,D-transpeptidase YcbB/YkuD